VRLLKPALQFSQGRSLPWSGAVLVNAFSEKADGDKLTDFAIMAIPGLALFKDIASAGVRGVHRMINTLYAVVGSALYSVPESGAAVSLGTVGGTNPVRMVDNGRQIAIHGGPTGQTAYVLDGTTLYTQPTNLPPVSDVGYLDGYFIWTLANSDQFMISALGDGLSYDPLDVATVEGAPDYLVGVMVDHREAQFHGTDTIEIWYNSGAADFPLQRQGNAFIERGSIDKNSIVKIDNSTMFVGDDRVVYRLDGYNPIRVSTHAIEYQIAHAAWFRAFTYTQEGHKFYVLNTDVGTFAYDAATGGWHERQSFGLNNYRVGCATTAYGQNILGDAYTGKLYVPSLDTYDENGSPIPVTVELPTVENSRERMTLYALELYCETGVGNVAVADPQVIMQYSRDGGRTYSNEMWRSMGRVGEYQTRAVWRTTVEFRQLAIRFTMPEKVRRFVMAYYADIR